MAEPSKVIGEIPKWAIVLDIFLNSKNKSFTRKEIVKITGVNTKYVSKYLCEWSKMGILRKMEHKKGYFLDDVEKAFTLINRSVNATRRRVSPTVSPIPLTTKQHNPRVNHSISFPKSVVAMYKEMAERNKDLSMFRLSGRLDRARQLTHSMEHCVAVISTQTSIGTVYVREGHENADWKAECESWYNSDDPDDVNVLMQLWDAEMVGDWENTTNHILSQALRKKGIFTQIEWKGSKTHQLAIETHGITKNEMMSAEAILCHDLQNASIYIATLERDIRVLKDQVGSVHADIEMFKALSSQQSRVIQEQSKLLVGLTDRLTEFQKLFTQQQGQQQQNQQEPKPGMFG